MGTEVKKLHDYFEQASGLFPLHKPGMTVMALLVVKTSFFPRHGEVKACCLMTVGNNQSGTSAALTIKPSDSPGWRTYMFLRLTCYLNKASLIRRPIEGLVADSFESYDSREAVAGVRNADSIFVPPLESGAFSPHFGNTIGTTPSDAPQEPVTDQFWSTVTLVDIAGWTQMVIQRGLRVLSDVSLGRFTAITNGSINDVPGVALYRAAWLRFFGKTICRDGTSRYHGWPALNSSFISCPNNNEVKI